VSLRPRRPGEQLSAGMLGASCRLTSLSAGAIVRPTPSFVKPENHNILRLFSRALAICSFILAYRSRLRALVQGAWAQLERDVSHRCNRSLVHVSKRSRDRAEHVISREARRRLEGGAVRLPPPGAQAGGVCRLPRHFRCGVRKLSNAAGHRAGVMPIIIRRSRNRSWPFLLKFSRDVRTTPQVWVEKRPVDVGSV
jgi:hypothetical protein